VHVFFGTEVFLSEVPGNVDQNWAMFIDQEAARQGMGRPLIDKKPCDKPHRAANPRSK